MKKMVREFIENKVEELRLNLNLLIEEQINCYKEEMLNRVREAERRKDG